MSVAASGVSDLIAPQGVHKSDRAAGAQDPHGVIEVLRSLFQVAIQDNHVVTAGSHAWQNIEGRARR